MGEATETFPERAAVIRLASPDELNSLASLIYQSFVEYQASYTDDGFAATTPTAEQLAKRMSEGPIWVAVRDDVLLGTVSVVRQGDDLYVRGMAVLPPARGMRLGELLLKTVEGFARTQGCKRLTLSTTPFLLRAIRLYEKFGFARTADGPHDLFGTPLFTMVKEIPRIP
jgi:GNAT superfamily N-acetyltransferase